MRFEWNRDDFRSGLKELAHSTDKEGDRKRMRDDMRYESGAVRAAKLSNRWRRVAACRGKAN